MKRILMNSLISWKDNSRRKPLVLKGARQVGKTFLLQTFGEKYFPKTHYLNFEKRTNLLSLFERDLDPKRILKELSFLLKTSIDQKKDLLIFDEIQECPRALTSLKYFCEEMPELALASAGSLLGVHLTNNSFPVGKVDFLTLFPMNFEEFLEAINEQSSNKWLEDAVGPLPEEIHRHVWERLKWYFITGGLPEVVKTFTRFQENLFEAFQKAREVQYSLIDAYNSDMAKHSGKVNAMHLDRLWKAIPHQLSKEVDGSIQRFRFKDAVPGINRYSRLVGVIDWLEAAGLILKVKITQSGNLPFSAYTSENAFKLLLFDVGLLGALSELSPEALMEEKYGSYKGYFAENFIAQEFIAEGMQSLYSWQEGKAEVDFLKENKGLSIPIEVKSGHSTRAKSLSLFSEKYNSPYKILLSGQNLSLHSSTKKYPLYMASFAVKN